MFGDQDPESFFLLEFFPRKHMGFPQRHLGNGSLKPSFFRGFFGGVEGED